MTMKLFSVQKSYESMKHKKEGERQRTQIGTDETIFFKFSCWCNWKSKFTDEQHVWGFHLSNQREQADGNKLIERSYYEDPSLYGIGAATVLFHPRASSVPPPTMEVTFLGVKCEQGEIEMGTPSGSLFWGKKGQAEGKKKSSSRGRMEEMRENPRLAGGVELCEKILHFWRGIRIQGDGSNPRGRGEYLHQLLGSQVFLSLWEKKKRTNRDPGVRSSIWWGHGSLGLLEKLSSKVWARQWLWERKMVRGCSGGRMSGQATASGRVVIKAESGRPSNSREQWGLGSGNPSNLLVWPKKFPLLLSGSWNYKFLVTPPDFTQATWR